MSGGVALRSALGPPSAQRRRPASYTTPWDAPRPAARIAGFTLSPMIHRPRAHELIIGMSVDANFGPMIMFGAGGTAVEVVVDTSLALPPLDPQLARDLIPSSLMFDPSNPHDPGV